MTLAVVIGTTVLGLSVILMQLVPSYRPHLKIGRVGKFTTNNLPKDILAKISSGLVQVGENGEYEPGIAESWEISDNGKTYTFQINSDLEWHDGKKVTPEDISYNFQEVTQSIDGNIITYTLGEPFSPFLSTLTRPLLRKNTLGVGEYRISDIKEKGGGIQSLTLGSSSQIITYKFYPTENASLTAYKLGEINQLEGLSYVPAEITNEARNTVTPTDHDKKLAILFFNNSDVVLTSKSTRQALAYAIKDKSFGKKRIISPIPMDSWVHNENVKTYEYDLEHAKSLLALDIQDIAELKLDLKTTLQYLEVAEEIATNWRDGLGIKVDVKVVPGITNDYQILLADYAPPLDPDQYGIWHSTQKTNFTRFTNLKVDKLLEDGRRTLDKKLRTEIYEDFQRFLLEDSPAVFLFETNTQTITRKSIFE
jgi:peptide/nickel transport system substrate-binding protein